MKTTTRRDRARPGRCSPCSPAPADDRRRPAARQAAEPPSRPSASAECADVETSTGPVSVTDSFGRTGRARPARRAGGRAGVAAGRGRAHALRHARGRRRRRGLHRSGTPPRSSPTGVERRRRARRAEPRRAVRHQSRPGDRRGLHADRRDHRRSSRSARSRCWPPRAPTPPIRCRTCSTPSRSSPRPSAARSGPPRSSRSSRRTSPRPKRGRRRRRAATEFVYFDGWIQGGNVALRPFGQGSLMGELGEALGMTQRLDRRGRRGRTASARPTSRA